MSFLGETENRYILFLPFASYICGRRGITSDDLFHFIFAMLSLEPSQRWLVSSFSSRRDKFASSSLYRNDSDTSAPVFCLVFELCKNFKLSLWSKLSYMRFKSNNSTNCLSLNCLQLWRRVLLRMPKAARGLQSGVSANISKILILSALDLCHSVGLLLTHMVMDTPALVADPHFSLPLCHSPFPLSISLIFSHLGSFFLGSRFCHH